MPFLQINEGFADALNRGKDNHQPEKGTEEWLIDPRQAKVGNEHGNEDVNEYAAEGVFAFPFGL